MAENVMFNAARRTVTLLVEGAHDRLFWRIWCDETCLVRQMAGRPAALAELRKGAATPDAQLLAVLDADLDRLTTGLSAEPDVVWTDAHDLETTLLGLPALEKLWQMQAGASALLEQERKWGETLRVRLFRHADTLGRLRWLKLLRRGELDILEFSKRPKSGKRSIPRIAYTEKSVDIGWSPSATRAIQTVLNYSEVQKLKAHDIAAACAALGPADPAQVCNGHDLMGLLAVGFEVLFKVKKSADEWTEQLLLAVERAWLAGTQMWQDLLAWEAAHPGFRVLKPAGGAGARPT